MPNCLTCERILDEDAKVCPYCGRRNPLVARTAEKIVSLIGFLVVAALALILWSQRLPRADVRAESAGIQTVTTASEAISDKSDAQVVDVQESNGADALQSQDSSAATSKDSASVDSTNSSMTKEQTTDQISDDEFPYKATLFDDRGTIVLQSEPSIIGKNVAKLSSGDTVYTSTQDGKWIRIKTTDGLVGFVRQKQLQF